MIRTKCHAQEYGEQWCLDPVACGIICARRRTTVTAEAARAMALRAEMVERAEMWGLS